MPVTCPPYSDGIPIGHGRSLMKFTLIRSIVCTSALASASLGALAQDMTGAGSSFAAPIYSKWADSYNKVSGARLNYQSIGSGAGLQQIRSKTVDFGASDMPLVDADLAKD